MLCPHCKSNLIYRVENDEAISISCEGIQLHEFQKGTKVFEILELMYFETTKRKQKEIDLNYQYALDKQKLYQEWEYEIKRLWFSVCYEIGLQTVIEQGSQVYEPPDTN